MSKSCDSFEKEIIILTYKSLDGNSFEMEFDSNRDCVYDIYQKIIEKLGSHPPRLIIQGKQLQSNYCCSDNVMAKLNDDYTLSEIGCGYCLSEGENILAFKNKISQVQEAILEGRLFKSNSARCSFTLLKRKNNENEEKDLIDTFDLGITAYTDVKNTCQHNPSRYQYLRDISLGNKVIHGVMRCRGGGFLGIFGLFTHENLVKNFQSFVNEDNELVKRSVLIGDQNLEINGIHPNSTVLEIKQKIVDEHPEILNNIQDYPDEIVEYSDAHDYLVELCKNKPVNNNNN